MTTAQFTAKINNRLSIACSLPFRLPDKALEVIIDEAAGWFYNNYEYAVEDMYIAISKNIFNTDQYKNESSICLDNNVKQVYDVHRVDYGNGLFGALSDFSTEKFIFKDFHYSDTYGDGLVQYMMYEYWVDTSKHLTLHPVKYRYNDLTKKFRVLGETPNTDIVLEVSRSLTQDKLYEDDYFYRYVLAMGKKDLGRMIGTFEFPMPGNVTINYDLIRSEGEQELQDIIQNIKDDEGTDFFYVSHH